MNGAGRRSGPHARPQPSYPRWSGLLRLVYPGIGLKRWLLVGGLGIAVCAIGAAYLLRKLLDLKFPDFLPAYFEGVLFIGIGIFVILLAIYGLYRSIGPLLFEAPTIDSLADTIYTRRARSRGPRIVVIGGGTGLSVLLRGLKAYTDNLTAIITVADDGGSSGRLRREMGVLPPGDFRNCLVAMSDAETLLTELFQYRFDQGDGLRGHSFGNLFIVAMNNITNSFEQALIESSRVLAVHGRIVPSTVANLRLDARLKDGSEVHGESTISELEGEIERVSISPDGAEAYPLAVEALAEAQLIAIGPGSLYTSILPNLLVSGIARAVRDSCALKMYVCNVATQKGETEGYDVANHVDVLQRHTYTEVIDYVMANDNPIELGPPYLGQPVLTGSRPIKHAKIELGDLIDRERPVRHDSEKLAELIMDVYHRDRGGRISFLTASR